MRNGSQQGRQGPGIPSTVGGLRGSRPVFQGPKRLGFLACALQAWELGPAHRLLQIALMDPAVTILPRNRSALPQQGQGALRGERTMTRVSDELLMFACATALHGDRAGSEPAN